MVANGWLRQKAHYGDTDHKNKRHRRCSYFHQAVGKNYRVVPKMVAESGSQFFSKLFEAKLITVGRNLIANTEYYPQTNDQAEHFNSTLVSRLRLYKSDHETDLDLYLLLLVFDYNEQVHRFIKVSSFSWHLRKLPMNPLQSYRNEKASRQTKTCPCQCTQA